MGIIKAKDVVYQYVRRDEEGNVIEEAPGYVDITFDVAELEGMVPDTVAVNAMNQYYDDALTYAKFTVSPITAGEEEEPQGILGDVNGDGRISIADARTLVVAVASAKTQDVVNGDVTKDDKITIADARKIVVAVAKNDFNF